MSDLRHTDAELGTTSDCLHCLRPIVLVKSAGTGKPVWLHEHGGIACPPVTRAEPMELEASDV